MNLTTPQIYNRIIGRDGIVRRCFTIPIGFWDMMAVQTRYFSHGLIHTNIVGFQGWIWGDPGENYALSLFPFDYFHVGVASGVIILDSTNSDRIQLTRATAGVFNSVFFNNPGFERGHIDLWYKE